MQQILHEIGIQQWLPRQPLAAAKPVINEKIYKITKKKGFEVYLKLVGSTDHWFDSFVDQVAVAMQAEYQPCSISDVANSKRVIHLNTAEFGLAEIKRNLYSELLR